VYLFHGVGLSAITVAFGISASVPGVVRVLANIVVNAPTTCPVIVPNAVNTIGSGLTPSSKHPASAEQRINAVIAIDDTTIVIMLFDVAGIVKFTGATQQSR
jgi:hypothetical protein